MYRKACLVLILPLIVLSGLFNRAVAQDLPGKRDSLQSTVLNEKRFIQVVLPEKYKPGSADKYDVLYVLDGEGTTRTVADIQHFIESESFMPPTIIVGVINVDRDRDFLPTHSKSNNTSGGAPKFLSFFKNELIPYINKTYPSNGDNTLIGHSFGGVFVTYALLNEPSLFKSYIAADPSYWWDHGIMRQLVKDKLAGIAGITASLYVTGREGSEFVGMGIPPVDTLFQKYAPASLTWKVMAYPGETHGSVRLKSFYDGLKFSYGGFANGSLTFHPMNGMMMKDKPIKIWYFTDPTKIRYTTDGSVPTLASAKMENEITLTGPGKLTLRQFTNRGRYDKTVTGEFKIGTIAPVAKAKNAKAGGLNYKYYEGNWDKLPDFDKLTPVTTGKIDSSFNFSKLPRKDHFGLVFEGQIEITEDGYYAFALSSDDGSKFYIGSHLLMDNDGIHGSDDLKSYILPLSKGFYPVRLEYFQKDGGMDLRLKYLTPSIFSTKEPIDVPLNLQYSK